jgi:ABC-2 type transport system permease protein
VQILVAIGSAQAVYFALFTAQFGVLSIYDEKKQGTLDRILAAPVARASILVGKLLGSFAIVTLQLSLLMLALTLIASIMEATPQFIWGPYPLLVLLTVLVIALSVSGIAVFIVGVARTAEQVNIVGPVLYSSMGALGGAFGFQIPVINQLSPIFWGTNALVKLTSGNLDIGLNLLILLVQGAVMFVIGSRLFARRTGL